MHELERVPSSVSLRPVLLEAEETCPTEQAPSDRSRRSRLKHVYLGSTWVERSVARRVVSLYGDPDA